MEKSEQSWRDGKYYYDIFRKKFFPIKYYDRYMKKLLNIEGVWVHNSFGEVKKVGSFIKA